MSKKQSISLLQTDLFQSLQQLTLYVSDTTASEITATLSKELQSVLEWAASNKLVLNISKTKSIVFGTNNFLSSRPQLNLVTNGMAVEQVEET